LNYPILSDPTAATAKAYGIHNGRFSSRVTFFIDKSGKIAHIEKKVKVGDHGTFIAEKLKELTAK